MDHSSAHFMEFNNEPVESKTITSEFTHQTKVNSLGKSEHGMHNKEQHQQSEFYKKLEEVIRNYDEVLLFGPTNAKSELLNLLKADNLFANIKIESKQTDRMTDNQQMAFVKKYFTVEQSHSGN